MGVSRHGQAASGALTRVYRIWVHTRQRCQNPRYHAYKDYGARGIAVCVRWQIFEHFLADMGEPPPNMTLERVNNNGGYEKANCRWATRLEQRRNQRRCRITLQQAHEIVRRCRAGETQRAVAKCFGVAQSAISNIFTGVSWPEAAAAQGRCIGGPPEQFERVPPGKEGQ